MVLPTYAEHIAAVLQNQHTEINKTTQRIGVLLRHRPKPPLLGHQMSEVMLLLKLLEEQLDYHFHVEARHGSLKEVREVFPRLAGVITKTENEHPQLLEDLDSVWRAASALSKPKSGELAGLERKFKTFLNRLNRHQQKENRIIQDAYNFDIGAGD